MFVGDMLNEATAIVDGYTSYFSFSKVRSGYSGNPLYILCMYFDMFWGTVTMVLE